MSLSFIKKVAFRTTVFLVVIGLTLFLWLITNTDTSKEDGVSAKYEKAGRAGDQEELSTTTDVVTCSGTTARNTLSRPWNGSAQFSRDSLDQSWTDRVTVEGKLNTSRKYAVFSFTIDNANGQDYMFYAPLTTLAWKRIGYDSVILIVGSVEKWLTDPVCRYIRSACLQLDAILIQLYAPPSNAITVSQVGRIFAANILSASDGNTDFVYMITSDSDLWPLSTDIYNLQSDMAILSINSECCGNFVHRERSYKMLPMSNIGMRVTTWTKITKQESLLPKSSHDILKFLENEFGDVALKPAVKGENRGWYLDQLTISMMIKNWTNQFGIAHVMFAPRNTWNDRIDRSRWKGDSKLDGMVDAHLPLRPFLQKTWNQITPLLRSMYGFNSNQYNWSIKYLHDYCKMMSDDYM